VSEAPPAVAAPPIPAPDCPLCPRLAAFRAAQRLAHPDWFNAPVPSFGDPGLAELLIVGLAPGLRGANRTGRPFTGDFAGDLLYRSLLKYGFATGDYRADPADGLVLRGARITNAVRCVPPQNRPEPGEIVACGAFLAGELAALSHLKAILALGAIAHNAVLAAKRLKRARCPFRHGALYELPDGILLADSYHCSRLNTNTGRLTPAMFEEVVAALALRLAAPAHAVRNSAAASISQSASQRAAERRMKRR
jgi:uracil-DNA glycosylase